MVIVGMMSYPPEHAEEMSRRFVASDPVPSYMTLKGPYLNSEVGGGFKVLSVYEFEQSKVKEAYEVVINRYSKFTGIPGYTFSIKIWLEMSD